MKKGSRWERRGSRREQIEVEGRLGERRAEDEKMRKRDACILKPPPAGKLI